MEAVSENITNPVLKNKYLVSGFWGSLKNNLSEEKLKAVQIIFLRTVKKRPTLPKLKMPYSNLPD